MCGGSAVIVGSHFDNGGRKNTLYPNVLFAPSPSLPLFFEVPLSPLGTTSLITWTAYWAEGGEEGGRGSKKEREGKSLERNLITEKREESERGRGRKEKSWVV